MTDKAISDYLAGIGSKGGKAKGARKARSPEHYKKLGELHRQRAKLAKQKPRESRKDKPG